MHAACHLRQHIESLLLLKGIKPSFLIAHYTNTEIFTEMVEQCLKPVMETHSLERYGFQLYFIDHLTLTDVYKGFQDGWILVDALSLVYPTVEKVFITPYKGKKMDDDLVGTALGYPTKTGDYCVRAVDITEQRELADSTKQHACCVTAFEFFSGSGARELGATLNHWRKCVAACREVGTTIKMDFSEHPDLGNFMAIMENPDDPRFRTPTVADIMVLINRE